MANTKEFGALAYYYRPIWVDEPIRSIWIGVSRLNSACSTAKVKWKFSEAMWKEAQLLRLPTAEKRRAKTASRDFVYFCSFLPFDLFSCTPSAIGGELVIFSVSSQRTPPRYTCFEFGKTWTYGNPLLIRPAPISEPIAKHIPNPRSGSRLENWTRVLAFESINLCCTKDWVFCKSECVCDKIHSLCYSSATKERTKMPYGTS